MQTVHHFKTTGAMCQHLRATHALTQAELAERCQCSVSTISRVERDAHKQGIPLDLFIKIGEALGKSPQIIFSRKPTTATL